MITKEPSFVTSDRQRFDTLDAAIGHELGLIFPDGVMSTTPVVEVILKNRDKIVDLLTTTKTSKPRARKINGASKKRTPKPDAAAVNRELQDGKQ